MASISLVPYVCGAGASVAGAEQGALYSIDHGLTEKLKAMGIDIAWAVDPYAHWNGPYGQVAHASLPPRGTPERREIVSWHCQAIAKNVAAELRSGNRVVTIGGDHSMAAGSVAGMCDAMGEDSVVGLIWIDAHPDLNTYEVSVTKALHGVPVADLLGLDKGLNLSRLIDRSMIEPRNVLYAGLRSIDDAEYEIAARMGIKLLSMEEMRQNDLPSLFQDRVMDLASRCDHLVMSIDLDAFDPAYAPATGSPVPGGFAPDEILPLLAGVARTYSVPLIEIVEFNPTLPGAEKTCDFMAEILGAVLPKSP